MKNSKNRSNRSEAVEGNTGPQQPAPAIRWAFTVNNWSENEYKDLLSYFSSNSSKFIIGKEIGEQGTPHLQGYVEFSKKLRLTQIKKIKGFERANLRKCDGTREDNFIYCSKDGDFITNLPYKKPVKIINELLPFQKSLESIALSKPDEGKIIWVFDEKGQTGKTQFLRYMNIKYGVPFAYGGKCADIINLAFNNKEYLETTECPTFLYNFGRETQNDKISYNSMEQLADGAIANTKFEAQCFVFNQPNIIILANCLPLMNKLTASRWIIKSINDNLELIDYVVKPLEEPLF